MPIELAPLALPDYGLPVVEPIIPSSEYTARIGAARRAMRAAKFDVLVVYGDREHFANLAYLSGYDPRFEEALCVLPKKGRPTLLVGNEGAGYAALTSPEWNIELYQTFSLLAQPRDRLAPLKRMLRHAGVRPGMRVGVAGWKYFERGELKTPRKTSELPSWIFEAVKDAAVGGTVRNATVLFMHPTDGLRVHNSVHQLARFEYASTLASQMVRDAIFNLGSGQTEFDAVRNMRWCGWPLSCHLMLSAGPRAAVGLGSPSSRAIQQGEPFTTAVGLWGALTARAGFLVHESSELPLGIRDYVDKLVIPYFKAAVAWYETIEIGVTGGEIYSAVHDILVDPFFGVTLNPGHLIHLDEWVHSPITPKSRRALASGMALQIDIIPATGTAYFTSNIEDGIAIADESLRGELAQTYPEAWARITARREFMQETLGIRLKPEVLPFSNLAGYLPPYVLSPQQAMRVAP
jgi:hypothetical protein